MSQDYAATYGVTDSEATVEQYPATAPYSLFTRLAAEAFGTFILTLGIVATWTFTELNQRSVVPVALAAGILLMAGMATVGHVSGGHFNPAVSFGMAIAGRLPWRDVLPYWLAQLIGAAVTSVIVWAIIPTTFPALLQVADRGAILGRSANGFGSHSPLATLTQGQSEFSLLSALLVEVIATAVFVGIFLAVTGRRSERLSPAVVVGLGFGALTILAWPVTNAGLNPARSLASVLMAGEGSLWGQYWVFFVAPLVGGGLAALFWRAFAPVPVADDELEDETDEVDEPELEVVEPVEAPRPVDPTSLVPPVEPVTTEPVTPEPVTPAEAVAPAEPAEPAEAVEPAEPGVEGTDAPKKPGEPQA